MIHHRHNLDARLLRSLFLIALCAWTGGCTSVPALPKAETSTFFETFESGFSISAREGTVRYIVTLTQKTPRTMPLFLTVHYENPAAPDSPHLEQLQVAPEEELVFLESPPLTSLEANTIYRIQIDIFEDPERTEQIDQHEIFILSTIETKRYGR